MLSEYSIEQVFNCAETGLQYRLLPHKTMVSYSLFEKIAKGREKCEDWVTICACANVTGSIMLPLLIIGKATRLHCFYMH